MIYGFYNQIGISKYIGLTNCLIKAGIKKLLVKVFIIHKFSVELID